MDYIIATIGLMSLFDLHCTLKWIIDDPCMEANPFMQYLWATDPIIFILFKITATLIFCLIALKFKNNKLLRRLIWLPLCVYVFITFVHCGGLI